MDILIAMPPQAGMDPDDHSKASKSLDEALAPILAAKTPAEWVATDLFRHQKGELKGTSAEKEVSSQKLAVDQGKTLLKSPIERDRYAQAVANETGVSLEAMRAALGLVGDESNARPENVQMVLRTLPASLPRDPLEASQTLQPVFKMVASQNAVVQTLLIAEIQEKYPALTRSAIKQMVKDAAARAKDVARPEQDIEVSDPAHLHEVISGFRAEGLCLEDRVARITLLVWEYLRKKNCGAFFTHDGEAYLVINGTHFSISKNLVFSSFLNEEAGINIATQEGKAVLQGLRDKARAHGRLVAQSSGIYTDLSSDAIYISLNNDKSELVRLSPQKIEVIPNGLNPYGVFILPSDLKPIHYLPDADVAEAMGLFKSLILDNQACSISDRYFSAGWFLAVFLRDYTVVRTLLKFSGSTAEGKSTLGKLFVNLVMGFDYLEGQHHTKDLFIRAAATPVLPLDNVESSQLHGSLLTFLLWIVTGIISSRRKLYTDSTIIKDQPRCFVFTTSIEPYSYPELINRCFDVPVSKGTHGNPGFDEMETLEKIRQNRDPILSAVFKLIANEILPTLRQKRREHLAYLKSSHRGNPKERCDECTALVAVVAEVLLRHFEGRESVTGLIDSWMRDQRARGGNVERETVKTLQWLNTVVREYQEHRDLASPDDHRPSFPEKYHLHLDEAEDPIRGKYIEFACPARDLFHAIGVMAKNFGQPNPFRDTGVLTTRLKNDRKLLADSGWEITWNVTTVHGTSHHRFRFYTEDEDWVGSAEDTEDSADGGVDSGGGQPPPPMPPPTPPPNDHLCGAGSYDNLG